MQRSIGSGSFCCEDDIGKRKEVGLSHVLSRSHEGHEETKNLWVFRGPSCASCLRDEDVSGSASSRRPCGHAKQRIAVEPGKRRRRLTMLRLDEARDRRGAFFGLDFDRHEKLIEKSTLVY